MVTIIVFLKKFFFYFQRLFWVNTVLLLYAVKENQSMACKQVEVFRKSLNFCS